MFDAMAQRYGVLPSHLLKQGDSFDLMIIDVAMTYEQMQQNKANKKVDMSMYDQNELQSMMDRVKGKSG
tara:strand:+ start:1152 stop:1358 length:207 start_codon:yes stop_codon:yes gene_type:complete